MEPSREELQGIMRRNGLDEREALAAYHLHRAWEGFEELYGYNDDDPILGFGQDLQNQIYFGVHFSALNKMLGLRVLQRDYPEGWGGRPATSTEE
jgi:hypothetical protein